MCVRHGKMHRKRRRFYPVLVGIVPSIQPHLNSKVPCHIMPFLFDGNGGMVEEMI